MVVFVAVVVIVDDVVAPKSGRNVVIPNSVVGLVMIETEAALGLVKIVSVVVNVLKIGLVKVALVIVVDFGVVMELVVTVAFVVVVPALEMIGLLLIVVVFNLVYTMLGTEGLSVAVGFVVDGFDDDKIGFLMG